MNSINFSLFRNLSISPLILFIYVFTYVCMYVSIFSPKTCLLILERREGEKHQCEKETLIGFLLYVPQPGIEMTT